MFQPSQVDVRQFFCSVYNKGKQQQTLEPMERLVFQWMLEHPEYELDFSNLEQALANMAEVSDNKENPFLHISMHLSISEQCSIDQPKGIRQAVELLTAKRGDLHLAHHEVMDCLGQMIWQSQRSGQPPDGHAYLEAVRTRATQDTKGF